MSVIVVTGSEGVIGPKIVEYIINIDVIREFINGIQSAWLNYHNDFIPLLLFPLYNPEI